MQLLFNSHLLLSLLLFSYNIVKFLTPYFCTVYQMLLLSVPPLLSTSHTPHFTPPNSHICTHILISITSSLHTLTHIYTPLQIPQRKVRSVPVSAPVSPMALPHQRMNGIPVLGWWLPHQDACRQEHYSWSHKMVPVLEGGRGCT